ncbi:hypothetical protein HYH03_010793 [Edaphochlamys debaryana]|uniref:Uncharacterized protein n=1 Tax=Edaphochlamys debaryana TaxID=47281 RepID=A0A835XW24_9CHLO|nr:hypothetical protein HYH03_010793 [Edaphochlamys debaryana]|eukprot:KAG2490875.1 hypothetical protein HYH03_010793 [Edaphochlamys debaryana]
MVASEHVYGCIAASSGIAVSSSVAITSLMLSKFQETAVAKDLKKVMGSTLPIHLAYIGVGTGAAAAQALKSTDPSLQNMWLASAALLASVVPYTHFLVKPDCEAIFAAGASGTAPPPGRIASLVKHGYVRVALMAAGTGIMVVALAKTHRK